MVSEAVKRTVNVAKTGRQIRLVSATVEHRHVVTSLNERSDDVAADEPRAAESHHPHAVIIPSRPGPEPGVGDAA